ncbi:hypothetical protein HQ38_08470 [Porphyromonas crevioricanis]|uniref:Transposase n=2 Tax=Porphyromonas crevioricanis TaxID=393921 RepID=A0AB34PFI9_9PORP|nr:hypothetical protein HQ38_08470 [Porphyromonas crevioricanis]GAD08050.1 hypothetical protein PORCAN_1683 [Porphyromonas crevioricanis JCM 13913]
MMQAMRVRLQERVDKKKMTQARILIGYNRSKFECNSAHNRIVLSACSQLIASVYNWVVPSVCNQLIASVYNRVVPSVCNQIIPFPRR